MEAQALLNQAAALRRSGQLAPAETILRQLLAAMPGHPMICFLLGGIRQQLGDHAEAIRFGEVALRARPDNLGALLLMANALQGVGRFEEAVTHYDRVIAADPKNADAFNNRGNALGDLGRDSEAIASFDAALALQTRRAMFWYNRGILMMKLNHRRQAVEDFTQAITLEPGNAAALGNRGAALVEMGHYEEALADHNTVLRMEPRNPQALVNRAGALMYLQRHDEALAAYDAALALDPTLPRVLGQMAIAALHDGNWARVAAMQAPYCQAVRDGTAGLDPLTLIGFGGDGTLMRQSAHKAMLEKLTPVSGPLWTGRRYAHERLRIAYVSSDMHGHPVGYLMAPLLERHDHARFEIIVISIGQAEGGETRARIMAACDHFCEMGEISDREVAEKIHALEADIVVDLNGHTCGWRPGIFAWRPAPVQATWLGFPGTTGANFIDYIIADAVVAPAADQPFYSEKIVHLPSSVFPFDPNREIGTAPSRADEGLADGAFVFCCFNRGWKITAAMFDIWMRLLKQVAGSVLWLGEGATPLQQQLRQAATDRGVDPARLVFAQKRPIAEHLARHRLADLFLDTVPYNAHATAADALLAGLPVLTLYGNLFAGRVGASMLTAAGVPELVTQTPQEYEALALTLARDPARLAAFREKLNRREGPLFGSTGFVRDLEAVYLQMSGTQ